MFRSLQDLLDAFRPEAPASPGGLPGVQLACAVLLTEVVRGQDEPQHVERTAVYEALRRRFGLDEAQLRELVTMAEQAAGSASDYFQFTSALNDALDTPAKIALVESMWSVAYADGNPDPYEMHVISRIAGLLEVTHGEYIAAKLHARQAAGL
jgi:uncharacterized tellurite resistance protein B-like protein